MTELIRSLKPGNADNAAEEFGRTSIGLEFGHAYGYNIVTGFGEVPTRDLAAIYVRTAGIEGAFLMDATSYAWDANGLVISSDLSLVGVTGYVGATRPASSWLRLPVSTAGLNAAPTPVEGVASKANSIAIPAGFNPANPASVAAALAALPVDGADSFRSTQNNTEPIGPFLESERHELFTGSVAVVIDYEYPLLLPTETFSLSTGVVAVVVDGIPMPAAVVTVAGLAPDVLAGVDLAVPAAVVTTSGLVPTIDAVAVRITPPAAALTVAGLAPGVSTGVAVEVPAGSIAVVAQVPTIDASAIQVLVPAAVITVAGATPAVTIGGGETYWSSWAEQNHGWWPESYPDWWAN